MSTEEEKENQKRYDVEWIMSNPSGRRFIWELLSFCGVYRSLEGDPNSMLVQEGTRRVGLHILGITTEVSDDLVFKMMLEAKNRSIEEIAKDDNTNKSTSPDSEYDYATGGYDAGPELPSYDTAGDLGTFL